MRDAGDDDDDDNNKIPQSPPSRADDDNDDDDDDEGSSAANQQLQEPTGSASKDEAAPGNRRARGAKGKASCNTMGAGYQAVKDERLLFLKGGTRTLRDKDIVASEQRLGVP